MHADVKIIKTTRQNALRAVENEQRDIIKAFEMPSPGIRFSKDMQKGNKKLQERIDELDKRIKAIMEPYSWMVEKLCEIPGIQDRVCEDLIAEIGLDMGNFPTSAHLCS